MKKKYEGNAYHRLSINLTPADEARIEGIFSQLQSTFGVSDKPSISMVLLATLKLQVSKDPAFLDGLWKELQAMSGKVYRPSKDDLKSLAKAVAEAEAHQTA